MTLYGMKCDDTLQVAVEPFESVMNLINLVGLSKVTHLHYAVESENNGKTWTPITHPTRRTT